MYFRRHVGPNERLAHEAMRYAVYFAPAPDTAWWRFGSAWLGRDAITGARLRPPEVEGLAPEDIERWTAAPRVYGWHATLKAPFRLSAPHRPADVYRETQHLAAQLVPVELAPLDLATIADFVVLRPRTQAHELAALAAACTRYLDRLRAQPSAEEIERRLAAPLTGNQRRMLERWGYPYAMEEFRFHMTLTGPLPADDRVRVLAGLRTHLAPLQDEALRLDALCIFHQPSPESPFALVRRCGFDGTTEVYGDE